MIKGIPVIVDNGVDKENLSISIAHTQWMFNESQPLLYDTANIAHAKQKMVIGGGTWMDGNRMWADN